MIVGIREQEYCRQCYQSNMFFVDLITFVPPDTEASNASQITYPDEGFCQRGISHGEITPDNAGDGGHIERVRFNPNCSLEVADAFNELNHALGFQQPHTDARQNRTPQDESPEDLAMPEEEGNCEE